MRYDEKADRGPDEAPHRTKMMRVVDAQGYHLRWIKVPVDKKTGPQGEGRLKGSCDKVRRQ